LTSWLKDLGEVQRDGSNVLLTQEQWDSLDEYGSLLQPTNPGPGRCWRTQDSFCWVEKDSGRSVLRKSLPALVIE
jgi:hypothetical protein